VAWTLSAFADEAGDKCTAQIAALQQAGICRLDLRGMDRYNIAAMPLEHARGVRQKLDAAGIAVAMLGSPIGKIDIADDMEGDLQKLRHLGALAPILGCHAVRIFSYYNKRSRPKAQWQDVALGRLAQLKDLAGQLGLVLYHENERHIFGDLCADVLTVAQALRDGQTFRLIFDFDNYNQSGENPWDNWCRLSACTDAFHLKDSRDGQHLPVGQGTGCVRQILADAVVRGWSGPLAIEPHLQHSRAVLATGPSGVAHKKLKRLPLNVSFQIACQAATDLIADVQRGL